MKGATSVLLGVKGLKELISSREKPSSIPEFPCHTQAVERVIKLVTEASNAVIGKVNREGFIKTRIEGRKRIPSLTGKKLKKRPTLLIRPTSIVASTNGVHVLP